jgi:hypothetical protein
MITAKNTQEKRNYEPVNSGNHVGRCVQMIELGSVNFQTPEGPKLLHKVRITWELPLETKVFKEENGEQPFVLSKEYTLSMHEKSNLRKDLEAWRGKKYSEEESKAVDITKLVGVPCMLNVVHEEKKGNVYANIASITPLPKGMVCPPQVNPSFVLSYDDFDFDKFNSLPTWLKEKMETTPEFQKVKSPSTVKEGVETGLLPTSDQLPF